MGERWFSFPVEWICLPAREGGLEGISYRLVKDKHGRRVLCYWVYSGEWIRPFCLKIYSSVEGLAAEACRVGWGLRERGFATPLPLYWGWSEGLGLEVLGMEWVRGGQSWPKYFVKLCSAGERRRFLLSLGSLMASLHREGIYHPDLSSRNFLVDSRRIWLLDLDNLRWGDRVPFWGRLKNLVQFFAAALEVCSRLEREYVFRCYRERGGDFDLPFGLVEFLAWRRRWSLIRKYRRKYGKRYSELI